MQLGPRRPRILAVPRQSRVRYRVVQLFQHGAVRSLAAVHLRRSIRATLPNVGPAAILTGSRASFKTRISAAAASLGSSRTHRRSPSLISVGSIARGTLAPESGDILKNFVHRENGTVSRNPSSCLRTKVWANTSRPNNSPARSQLAPPPSADDGSFTKAACPARNGIVRNQVIRISVVSKFISPLPAFLRAISHPIESRRQKGKAKLAVTLFVSGLRFHMSDMPVTRQRAVISGYSVIQDLSASRSNILS